MRGAERLSIGQLAARTGLSVSAIRYYEAEGLVSADRNAGGHRRFLRADIRRLSFALIARRRGPGPRYLLGDRPEPPSE
jgi:MerR family redox-sensitive transcriptional activator SoxR